ncbi:MAG: tetratricopeptide repeat protein [Flavobacteriales bacterium]
MLRFLLICFSLYLLCGNANAGFDIDSMRKATASVKPDTSRTLAYFYQMKAIRKSGDYQTAVDLGYVGLEECSLVNDYHATGYIWGELGLSYDYLNYADSCKKYFSKAFFYFARAERWDNLVGIFTNLGVHFLINEDYSNALYYMLAGLKVAERLNKPQYINVLSLNIGLIYFKLRDYEHARPYFIKTKESSAKSGDLVYQKYAEGNLAAVYFYTDNFDSAYYYYTCVLSFYKMIGDKVELASFSNNMGAIHRKQNNLDSAEYYYNLSLSLRKELGQEPTVEELNNLAILYEQKGEFRKAEELLNKALTINNGNFSRSQRESSYRILFQVLEKQGKYKEAVHIGKKYLEIKDSIYKSSRLSEISDLRTQYEVEKNEDRVRKEEALEKGKLNAISREERKRRNLIIVFLSTGVLFVGLFTFFLFQRFRITKRQNEIIEKQRLEVTRQKHLVEEKNKEVMDSITYAKRLQSAILPPVSAYSDHFRDSFVLYQPKDIVAGDFFFLDTVGPTVIFAVADCTGHGVPGAMVSVVCSNALSRSVNEFGLTDPGKILDKVTDLVLETFSKGGEEVRDGMDISLGSYNSETKELFWAGANNGLVLIRKNEITELKPDKQPVGKYLERRNFTAQRIVLQPDDCLYFFSDGYGDQFGGELSSGKAGGKKFKEGNLKKLLLDISTIPMEQQEKLLWNRLVEWRGELEQIDDICIMGLRI